MVPRKQALPDRVDLRSSQREDVAVQFRDNDSEVMSEDDRMSEKARKARAREMKLEKFDGTSSIDSFLAKFEICSRHNEWTEKDRMAHLQCAMVNNAAQILWDMGSEGVAKSSDFIAQLRARYGSANQTTLYRTQLKYRRRNRGESLAALVNDIRRMVVLAYPGPTSPMKEAVACDAFLEALGDAEMALKIREREPTTLEDAFQYALRLEAYSGSVAVKPADGDRRGLVRMLQEVQEPEDRCLEYLKEMGRWQQENFQQLFSEMRAALNSQPKANQETRVKVADSQRETPGHSGVTDGRSRRPVRPPPLCFGCGQPGHIRPQCPNRERPEVDTEAPRVQPVTNNPVRSEKGVYLPLTIGRRKCLALLDTGSETTLVPYSLVQGRKLSTSDQILRAANGSEIDVKGEIRIKVRVGGLTLPMDCIVVDDVTEMLIGMDWVSKYVETMDFQNQRAVVFGQRISLKRDPNGVVLRRIQVREVARISPKPGVKAKRGVWFKDSVCCESACLKPDTTPKDTIPCELKEEAEDNLPGSRNGRRQSFKQNPG